jgi:hypothetical protein
VVRSCKDSGELLAQVVVQVARDTRPLVLLCLYQSAGHVTILFVRLADRVLSAPSSRPLNE